MALSTSAACLFDRAAESALDDDEVNQQNANRVMISKRASTDIRQHFVVPRLVLIRRQ
jgi:hypothetical protein